MAIEPGSQTIVVTTQERVVSQIAGELQLFTPAAAGQVCGAELAALTAARADTCRQADVRAASAG
jgi:hypothetical protein